MLKVKRKCVVLVIPVFMRVIGEKGLVLGASQSAGISGVSALIVLAAILEVTDLNVSILETG